MQRQSLGRVGIGLTFLLSVAPSAVCVSAPAVTPPMAQIVRARRAHFKELGRAMKALADQLRESHPDWSIVVRDSNRMTRLAGDLPGWFPVGSGPESGLTTRARASIWAEPTGFTHASQVLAARVRDLASAVSSRDRPLAHARAVAVGRACGSCHRQFRAHSSWW